MTRGKAQLYRHEFLVCPWCGEQSGQRVDHLYDGGPFSDGFGPWYCKECRRGIQGRVIGPGDVQIWKSSTAARFSRSMALLRFDGADRAVFFVIDHDRFWQGNEEDEGNQQDQKYFFEEGSCPINWLTKCVEVIQDGEADPHGFLTFVRAVDVPNDFVSDVAHWGDIFPEAFEGPVIDGEALVPKLK